MKTVFLICTTCCMLFFAQTALSQSPDLYRDVRVMTTSQINLPNGTHYFLAQVMSNNESFFFVTLFGNVPIGSIVGIVISPQGNFSGIAISGSQYKG